MKMNKTSILAVLTAVALVVSALGVKVNSLTLMIIGLGMLMTFALKLWREVEGHKNKAAILRALRTYDAIIDGVRWVGKDAEILTWHRLHMINERTSVTMHLLCKTQKGAWFGFEVVVAQGRVYEATLRPLTDVEAQYHLQGHREIYAKYFGEPRIA